jgi:class 3 adenylate cyclase
MKCPRCQHENPPGSVFCLECGGHLAPACASCGAELPARAKFCNKCGTAVPTGVAMRPRFASPEAYTPKHLAEKILTSKSALEGERKQVTVLFADLKGSMELLADRDPEEARKLLDPVLERMMEAVHRYEGTVNQVMGDGIMALFGAPLAHEDHAVRGCYAALRMQESVKRYAEEIRRATGIPPSIRVGLNSGEVVVRAIGGDLRMDYTAVGQTTHLAARMEQAALPGTIVITPHTLRLAEGYVEVKSLGPLSVKGSEVLSERMFGELNEKQEEYLKDIYASGTHLLSLINDILDLSKIEAGRMELELTDFHLPQAIENALTLVRERAGRRGITLAHTMDERLGDIRGDERKIKQVLLNLLSNAIKFTPEAGRVEVRAGIVDGMAEISVTDTGGGHCPRGSGSHLRGVPSGGDGGEEGGGDRTGTHLVPEVHRAAWRANLGEKPGWCGLDVHVHDPGASWRMS